MTCSLCVHSQMSAQLGVTGLYCHAGPPLVMLIPDGGGNLKMVGLWPPVEATARCGQFAAPAPRTAA